MTEDNNTFNPLDHLKFGRKKSTDALFMMNTIASYNKKCEKEGKTPNAMEFAEYYLNLAYMIVLPISLISLLFVGAIILFR